MSTFHFFVRKQIVGAAQQSVQLPNKACCIVIFLSGMTKEPQLRLGFLVKRTFARIFTQEPEARRTSIEKSQRDFFRRVLLACGGYGNEVHCKQKWRSPKSESDLCLDSYYQEPHQFRFQMFKDLCTPAEVVLVSGHRMHCGCLVIFFWKTLQHLVRLVLSNSSKLRAPRQKAQNESSQYKKKATHLTS